MIRNVVRALALACVFGLAALSSASAQNVICSTAPYGTADNRCASTAFVQNAVSVLSRGTAGYALIGNGASVDATYQGFLQTGASAATRTWQSKVRDYPVTPEDFGATDATCATDQTTYVQRAVDSGKPVYIGGGCYMFGDVTITSGQTRIFGAGAGKFNVVIKPGATSAFKVNSAAANIENISISDFGIVGNNVNTEAGILFTGSHFIQHSQYVGIRCFQVYACFRNNSNATDGIVNWSLFSDIQVTGGSYGAWFEYGSGTGNVFSGWTTLIANGLAVEIGDGTIGVGDLIFTGMHMGGSNGIGIRIRGSATYGTNISITASQVDGGLLCGFSLIGPVDRVTLQGINWGGSTTPICTSGSVTAISADFSWVNSQTVSGIQHNYTPASLQFTKQLRLTASGANQTITGLAAQFDGFEIEVSNSGSPYQVILAAQNGASLSANQFYFPRNIVLNPFESVILRYDVTTGGWVALSAVIANSGVTEGTYGNATQTPQIVVNANGTISSASNVTVTPAASSITNGQALTASNDTNVTLTLGGTPTTALLKAVSVTAGWTGRLAFSRLTQGATNTVLANATSGTADFAAFSMPSCSTSSTALNWTTNTGFGCNSAITAAIAPAGTLTGTTLASNVVTSSLTSVGTIGTGVWQGTKVGLAYGGTNADLSATGGASQVLKQVSSGAAVTVARLACADLSDAGTGCTGSTGASAITALTGDVTATGPGSAATTLATVNSNVGTFGSATQASSVTVNAKGLVTAASSVTVTPSVSSITGLGTGVATALQQNLATAGAVVVIGGALGTPASGVLANATGLPLSGLTTQATNTVVGNATSGSASPTALSMTSCSTSSSAVTWTTNTGFGCNTSITANAVAVGGITGLGANVATWLATPTSANLLAAVATNNTGTGALVFATSPTFAGTPLAPTAAAATNTTQLATTAFVQTAIGGGGAWTAYTPTVTMNGGSGLTTGTVLGAYQKIGRMVVTRMKIPVTALTSPGVTLRITLPFDIATGIIGNGVGINTTSLKQVNLSLGLSAASTADLTYYDGTFPAAAGDSLWMTGFYESASWLFKRDLDPAANDNTPAFMNAVA